MSSGLVFPVVMMVMIVTVLLPSFFTFDRLVKREHDLYFEAWEADGRPYGMFWRPGTGWLSLRTLRSGWATNKCMLVWLFRTPTWARGDEEAMGLLQRLRRLALAWTVGLPVLFVVAIEFFYSPAAR